MSMLRRLLTAVNTVWNIQPKEENVFRIRQSSGQHTRMTLDAGQLHLHSQAYHATLPVKQTVILEDLTIGELITILQEMEYQVDVIPGRQRFLTEGAVTILPFRDVRISEAYTVTVFTSNVWRLLYPLARLLEDVEGDVDKAMHQMYLRSSKGEWLDYWASFFDVRRFIGESDTALVRRIILFLINPKTNNRAIEESLEITLKLSSVKITDIAPALFEVELEPEAMNIYDSTDNLLRSLKAGGVDFIYRYVKAFSEDYTEYLEDVGGRSIREMDGVFPIGDTSIENAAEYLLADELTEAFAMHVPVANLADEVRDIVDTFSTLSLTHTEAIYSHVRPVSAADSTEGLFMGGEDFRIITNTEDGFSVNIYRLNGPGRIMPRIQPRVREGVTMVMTDSNGQIVQSLT